MSEIATDLKAILFYFITSVILIMNLFQLRLKIRKWHVPIDYSSVPFALTILMCFSAIIPWDVIVRGLLGPIAPQQFRDPFNASNLIPLTVVLQFMGLAYTCSSAQYAGLFDLVAQKLQMLAIQSSHQILLGYVLFFLFSMFFAVFTSNDIVILCLTPIVLQFLERLEKQEFNTFLLSTIFASANIFSMSLQTSNGTNYILTQIIEMDFLDYLKVMLPLGLLSGIIVFFIGVVYLLVRNRSLIGYTKIIIEQDEFTTTSVQDSAAIERQYREELDKPIDVVQAYENRKFTIKQKFNLIFSSVVLLLMACFFILSFLFSGFRDFQLCYITATAAFFQLIKDVALTYLQRDFNFFEIVKLLPWKLPLFLLSMFILVENAIKLGITSTLSQLLKNVLIKSNDFVNILIIVSFSALVVLCCSNLPGAIVLGRILHKTNNFVFNRSAYFSASAICNVGALLLPHCSLAGLLWMGTTKKLEAKINWLHAWVSLAGQFVMLLLFISLLIWVLA